MVLKTLGCRLLNCLVVLLWACTETLAQIAFRNPAYFRDNEVKQTAMALPSIRRIPAAMGSSALVRLGIANADINLHELEYDPSWSPSYPDNATAEEKWQIYFINNKVPEQVAIGIMLRRATATEQVAKQLDLDLLVERDSILFKRPNLLSKFRDVTPEVLQLMEREEKEGKHWPYPNTPDGQWLKQRQQNQK